MNASLPGWSTKIEKLQGEKVYVEAAPVVGIIQLILLRKQMRELSTRVATSYQQVESVKNA